MPRILLADDSPHAQRMGERILREEGYEVVTVTDGDTAVLRMEDVNPDVVFADVSLPGRTGYDICRQVKNAQRFRSVRVILTAGLLEHFDDERALSVRCDAVLRKPFEATAMIQTVRRLIDSAEAERAELPPQGDPPEERPPVRPVTTHAVAAVPALDPNPDAERVRAAVTVALDAAMPALIDELTEKVLLSLRSGLVR
jgi:CheY-like chemotaxis protein